MFTFKRTMVASALFAASLGFGLGTTGCTDTNDAGRITPPASDGGGDAKTGGMTGSGGSGSGGTGGNGAGGSSDAAVSGTGGSAGGGTGGAAADAATSDGSDSSDAPSNG